MGFSEWWEALSGASRFFYGCSAFCSVFFLWQIIGAFIGLGGNDADVDTDFDADIDFDAEVDMDVGDGVDIHDIADASQAFRLFTLRSVVTFFTLFFWASAIYSSQGYSVTMAMGVGCLWGLGGMVSIALVFHLMYKLAENGTKDVRKSHGQVGTVYLDISADGYGEVRVMVDNTMTHIKAKSAHGEALPSGTQVRVVEVVDQSLVKVEALEKKEKPDV